jgi:tetratricopeptide (TPR) repeat protein
MKYISLLLFFLIFCGVSAKNNTTKDSCQAATDYYLNSKYKEAIAAATVCINTETDTKKLMLAYAFRSDAYERNKQYEQALSDVNQVIRLSPESGNYCSRAAIYKKLKKFDLAVYDYDTAIQKLPGNSVNYYFKGKCLFAAKRFEEAITTLNTCLKMQPNYANASAILAAIAIEQNNFTAAKANLDIALKNNSGSYEPPYYAGILAMKQNQFKTAVHYLNEAEKQDWLRPEGYIKKAECYAWLYQLDSARINIDKAKKTGGDISEITKVLTIIRSQEIPEINVEKIITNQTQVSALYEKAFQQKKEKKFSAAFKTISAAIKLEPTNSDLYSLSAEILLLLFEMENPDAVSNPATFDFNKNDDWFLLMDDLGTAIKLKPTNFAAYYLRANAFFIKQENKKAIVDFEKALQFIAQNPTYETEIKQLIKKAKENK